MEDPIDYGRWREEVSSSVRVIEGQAQEGSWGTDGCEGGHDGSQQGFWYTWQRGEGRCLMPLTDKGRTILTAMQKEYGARRGKSVFYASVNKGKIKGVHKGKKKK